MNYNDNNPDYISELEKNGVIGFVPGGNSMWPFLHDKRQSVVIEKKKDRLNKYDVALFHRESGSIILHRVMEVKDDGYVMCGDSQYYTEEVKEQNVHGVMIGFYQGKKYIEATNPKYVKKVKKWYSRKLNRKIRLKIFYFKIKVKNKLKSMRKKDK